MRTAPVPGAGVAVRVLTVLSGVMPLPILGCDTDNDTVFINETVNAWCEAAGAAFTRSRPYGKND